MENTVIDTFKRVEDKYLLDSKQANALLKRIGSHLKKDVFYQYTVHSLYYDSIDNQLMMQALEKPMYKTKIRLRRYGDDCPQVFLETKKKFDNIVYKRRIGLGEKEAFDYIDYGKKHHVKNNTAEEIDYLMNLYNPEAKALICYDRTCFVGKEEEDVRITFDQNIRYRTQNLSLYEDGTEESLQEGKIMIEVKVMDRYPIWLKDVLTEMKIYRTSFSKYGTIYCNQLLENKTHANVYTYENYDQIVKENQECSFQY